MSAESIKDVEVLMLGLGKAGEMHAGIYGRLDGVNLTVFDTNPDCLANLGPNAAKMRENGRLKTVANLDDVEDPGLVDIATPSGTHVDSIQSVLTSSDTNPDAWLIEKPVYSTPEELNQLTALLAANSLDRAKIFVDENYLASLALEEARTAIETEAAVGNPVANVDVVFYKNRVPDVLAGRFTDPTLGAFGIEMPHQVAIAYNLAGVKPTEEVNIIESRYDTNVHNVKGSDATYVVAETENGVTIRMAQGLGPFSMNADGEMKKSDDVQIIRYATATLKDGQQITINFDPVPGIDRYNSTLEQPEQPVKIMPDNTMARLLGSVVLFAKDGTRPPFAGAISVDNAINYVDGLTRFHQVATKSQTQS